MIPWLGGTLLGHHYPQNTNALFVLISYMDSSFNLSWILFPVGPCLDRLSCSNQFLKDFAGSKGCVVYWIIKPRTWWMTPYNTANYAQLKRWLIQFLYFLFLSYYFHHRYEQASARGRINLKDSWEQKSRKIIQMNSQLIRLAKNIAFFSSLSKSWSFLNFFFTHQNNKEKLRVICQKKKISAKS